MSSKCQLLILAEDEIFRGFLTFFNPFLNIKQGRGREPPHQSEARYGVNSASDRALQKRGRKPCFSLISPVKLDLCWREQIGSRGAGEACDEG